MFKKRFLLALAVAGITGLSFGNLNSIKGLVSAETTTATIVECTGGGSESFTNMPANSSTYATQSWTGDNGVAWQATDARTDQTLTGRAIAIRTGSLTNTSTVAGGIGTLTFNYARVFTGNSTLKVFVNDVQIGTDITVSSDTSTPYSMAVDVSGNVTIRIENSGNRTIIDNLAWDCSDAPAPTPAPELQIADACNTDQACGEYAIDFGTISVDNYKDAVFTIKNTGNEDLEVTALTLSDANFTVVSPVSGDLPLTIAPADSAIVLVRFEASTGGAKSGTLTIASNDSDEASCVINLEGTALAACVTPAAADEFAATNATSSTVDVVITNSDADSFLAIITTGTFSGAPVDGVSYEVGESLAGGVVAYVGTSPEFTITDLEEDTTYLITIYAFNGAACIGGPLYAEDAAEDEFETEVAPCIGGSESFTDMPANSSAYATRTWTGDNGVAWEATDARTDQTLSSSRAIGIRVGSLTNTSTISGGIGTLSFDYARIFTGNSVLKVYVNSVQVGADINVTSDVASTYSVAVDVTGDVVIEIENSGNRTLIDNLAWDCYSVPNAPELQLLDSNLANQPCGYDINFGNVETDTDNERTFTIQNRGLQTLNITDLVITDASSSYTILSPVTTSFTLAPNATQDVTIQFNNGTAGAYNDAFLTISSNDSDEASCVVNFSANAQDPCVAPDADGSYDATEVTDTTADIEITGNSTASGFIALVIKDYTGTQTAGVPADGTAYTVGQMIGDATVVYVGASGSFTVSDLTPSSQNPIYVYTYNSGDCFGGPVYSETNIEDEINTIATPCVGVSESFSNLGSNQSNYTVRTWTGDGGIVWTASDARTDQDLNGDAICFRNGTLENVAPVSGGIGTLSFDYARVFTNNSTLKVYVNGVQVGSDITVSSTTPTTFSQVVNVTGNITVELVNSGNRILVDDLAWDCYAGMGSRPGVATEEANDDNSFFQTTTTKNEVVLYPNPNDGEFQIELPSVDEAAQVEVFDTLGKQVISKKVVGKETINLENAGKGIYMVVITSGDNVTTKKVVIK
ncbi:choice-of-anchor D domain-containing protein [Flavobacterium salilacus subsp. salilacus]|uniref:choice-of-anchor D domain-containing protein n=1 Tax=Flavobacterium TaxID=237 RepID=UPI0010751548|nr:MULTISPECIES: choice-of-anchor D domain-containing protein [Flavobacterium]KAF2518564.1 choice-of-anchor D domain-containing protein [Flavobacterium salilacus subsp. salilacus]MBE1613520.1 choice-of-anchor D domain-containing protein [Flavobacterium sp. SaA2.13]